MEPLELSVVVRWGASVLETLRFAPPRSFTVATASGGARHVAVETDRDGHVWVAARRLTPGETVHIVVEGSTLEVTLGEADPAVSATPLDRPVIASHGASLLLHAAVLASVLAWLPGSDADEEPIEAEREAVASLVASTPDPARAGSVDAEPGSSAGDPGGRAAEASGKMGARAERSSAHAYGIAGHASTRSPSGDRPSIDPTTFGIIHVISVATSADEHVGGWGAAPIGSDPLSANGDPWGPDVGDAAGAGGLGLSGVGEGGGGLAHGVGLAPFGAFGRSAGTCDATCLASGLGHGLSMGHTSLGGSHQSGGVSTCGLVENGPREGCVTSVVGRLPPETIRRVIRQNFGRFRRCYEEGLKPQPSLAGRVTVRFVIGRDGSVSSAQNGGSDLPDASVVACVVRAFAGLSFPEPEGGVVNVSYPIMFSPGE